MKIIIAPHLRKCDIIGGMKIRNLVSALAAAVLSGCTTMQPTGELQEFEFPYVNDYSISNHTKFRWSDSYLTNRCDVYSQELAGPLSAVAASTYGYRMYMDVRTLSRLGFLPETMYRRYGADINYKHPKYGKNQVGFTFACKKTHISGMPTDVLIVAIRGTFGRDEWLSNMNACNSWGKNADADPSQIPILHEGFRIAADALEADLEKYIASNRIDLANAVILITGHSRGAAVANILGARLNEAAAGTRTGQFSAINRNNLHVYTFATPNTVLRYGVDAGSSIYGNIFNIINPEDMVPLVPLANWCYRRYGRDLFLKYYDALSLWGVWTDSGYNTMKDSFKQMTGYEWWHMPLGTNATYAIPKLLGTVAPSIPELYLVPPQQREDGNLTSIHSILETTIYRAIDDPAEEERRMSLGGDVTKITDTYKTIENDENHIQQKKLFYNPDGRDFSRQPGILDIPWRITCMHATQTYIGWMKAAEKHGVDAIYINPPSNSEAVTEQPCP